MSDQVFAVVSSHAPMRVALCDCLEQLGYPSLGLPSSNSNPILQSSLTSVSPATAAKLNAPSPWRLADCSMAIVDLNEYERELPEFDQALDDVADLPTLYIDQPLPESNDQWPVWNHQLAKKIAQLHAELQSQSAQAPSHSDSTWLLLGSTGGPEAVRAFVDALPLHCPVGFLYGQHINPGFENNLVSMLDGRRGFRAKLAETGDQLSTGTIHVIPANQRVYVLDGGVLLVSNAPWPGQFQPSLDTLVVDFGNQPLDKSGVIVFSGMGDDGSAALRLYSTKGGRIWVQTPQDCVVSSMPESALATSNVEKNDTPRALAIHLAQAIKGQK